MRFDVLTLFPEIFSGYLSQSLLKLAIENRLVEVHLHNIRDWAEGRHHVVDDRPYGGGPGMILKVEPVVECVEAVQKRQASATPIEPNATWRSLGHASNGLAPPSTDNSKQNDSSVESKADGWDQVFGHVIMLTPQGRPLTQRVVEELAAKNRLILLCGRYEGFDDRVRQILQPDEISIGDYVLGGGEVASMVVIDAVIRLIPGVLGHERSAVEDSFSGDEPWLEAAQFTRPREYRGLTVPEVLLGGNHAEIAAWRREQSLQKTHERRADLLPADHKIGTQKQVKTSKKHN
jgi:tRNA (guanine37-N1)-methyltransferase